MEYVLFILGMCAGMVVNGMIHARRAVKLLNEIEGIIAESPNLYVGCESALYHSNIKGVPMVSRIVSWVLQMVMAKHRNQERKQRMNEAIKNLK